jgi:hypothetical protein
MSAITLALDENCLAGPSQNAAQRGCGVCDALLETPEIKTQTAIVCALETLEPLDLQHACSTG